MKKKKKKKKKKKMMMMMMMMMKKKKYSAPIEHEHVHYQCSLDACSTILNRPVTIEMALKSTIRRDHASINSGGGHFEHLLYVAS